MFVIKIVFAIMIIRFIKNVIADFKVQVYNPEEEAELKEEFLTEQ